MFSDIVRIQIKAGKGGDGKVSFHREKYVAAGGPDGGDGGKGGSVIFQVDDNLSTLADFRYKRKYFAPEGENGKAGRGSGKNAENLLVKVPRGTLVKDDASGRIIADLSGDEPQIIAKGGRGGWGNSHFATPTRQVPRFAKPGLPGESMDVRLELKLLADVGLVGFPNVGKSTLISVVSAARPQIANYHFTTITPSLGVVRLSEGNSFVMADIPGLIEGAGEGAGLGHQFLRHVERCRVLIHIVDVSGSEGRNPIEDFEIINKEMAKFNPELAERPMIVAANKCDLATEEQICAFEAYIKEQGYEYFSIMAAIRHGVEPLLNKISEMLATLPPIRRYEPEPAPLPDISIMENKEFKIEYVDDTYVVESPWLLQVMQSVNFDDEESLQFFQRMLIASGIIDGLCEAGCKEGDSVSIYNLEFDFVD
ncbi:MAG: GTPase ObgE [Oscillospiraceae bacterium]|nr:GTPase ObgE [Oscillospiraceae bacterium]